VASQFYCTPLKYIKGVLNERISQTSAVATRSQPPKPASLRDAGFAPPVVVQGCGFSSARVWLCDDL